MSQIANIDFSDNAWIQASLPVSYGGLGIRRAADIALPCYIASAFSALSLVEAILPSVTDLVPFEVSSEVGRWNAEGQELTEPEGDARMRQKGWDLPRAGQLQKTLLGKADDQYDTARLLASAQPESGAWAGAIPVPSLGTQLSPEELRVAIALRTGSKICEKHRCKCKRMSDEYGFHALSCRFNEGRLPRHAAINDIICRALKKTNTPAILEPPGLNRNDGRRPDGLTLYPFSRGKTLAWDATCVNTFANSSINYTATEAGHAAAKAEVAKRAKYSELANRHRFEPIAFETTGVMGPSTKAIVLEIGKRMSETSGENRESLWLLQRLSIAIQRGNALSALSLVGRMCGYG